jgi:hypothetical protein
MPLAFLVEQTGVACLAGLWRIELQCDLPCKPFRLYSDAPLALLIGAQAKLATEIGAPSLKHPFARVFTADFALSPLANLKGRNAVPFQRQTKLLTRSTVSAFLAVAKLGRSALPLSTALLDGADRPLLLA